MEGIMHCSYVENKESNKFKPEGLNTPNMLKLSSQ